MGQLFLWTSLIAGGIWAASGFIGINAYTLDQEFRDVLSRRARKMGNQILLVFLVYLVVAAWLILRGPQV